MGKKAQNPPTFGTLPASAAMDVCRSPLLGGRATPLRRTQRSIHPNKILLVCRTATPTPMRNQSPKPAAETDSGPAPWTVVATDDKKTARLNIIRHILTTLNRPGQTSDKPDKDVLFPFEAKALKDGRLEK